ncbi:UNVERIFIED_CONTAM: Transposon Tf2-12 polyprotein [Sesamum latifolium]|uniref:Transposon Tf2-12 polyprotein n=1 Tax=Sesamum latifolium TaxID=2727402 RepID=A0AAW2WGT0_9LAMI
MPYEKPQRKPTLKEMQARQYPFLDSDISKIFDDLLEANLIDLPEMKRLEEVERKDDPKYCKYHSLEDSSDADDCMSTITFTDEDLLLGSKPHNHHLFIAGYVRDQKVNRILIDGGSAVNILPLGILKELGISIDELSNSRLMIQGFNQGGQRAIGIVRIQLTMGDMMSTALFHVIDTKTSYNMLLGRPWLHENTIIPSTWHQYFKYCRNGIVNKVLGYNKSFTEAESHFTDAKYYIEDAKKVKEVFPSEEPKSCGLGFTPPKPVRIAIKRVSNNYVLEEFYSTEDDKGKGNLRESFFNRLGPHRWTVHRASSKQSVFDRLGPCKGTNEAPDNFSYIMWKSLEDIAQTYYVTLIEDGEVEEEDAEDAPVELEEGDKATVDELKEVNLGNTEDPQPIYTSEVNKLIEVSFIREVKYPMWIFSIVPVRKKNGQIRVCVDFRDLNNACPKDDFPLPIAELMIDTATGYEALSFMDGSFGYHQIRMAPVDKELTAFRTPKGIYCYKVMPFGLKNTGATYQRAMQRIFDDMLHKNVECYVDDLVVKSKKREDHLYDLRKVFKRLRRYQLKMNPSKCAFGVTSGKFLGFIVRQRGIEIEQAKIDAMLRMPELQNIHELNSLQGKLAYLQRFISNLASRCQPFSRLMKKDVPFEWDEACDKAFKSIKSYLMKPPVLVAPVHGCPLILYVAAQEHSIGILLAQKNDEGKENALYYLSRTMTPNELKYSRIEKLCLTLIFAIQKLKHYFQSHSIHLVLKAKPLKYVMTKSVLSDRLARCDDEDDMFQEEENHVMEVFEVEEEYWRQPLVDYLKYGKLPNDPRRRTDTRRRAIRFIYYKGTLYKRSFEGIFLHYLSDEEKVQAMEEAHSGVCDAHQSGPKLYFRIKRMGYYWPTMVKDYMDYARRCQACQFHANLIHQPPEPLHPTVAS